MTAEESVRRRRWPRRLSAVFLSLLAFFALFAIDHAGDKGITPDNFNAPLYQRIFSSGFWYQFAVTGCWVKRSENRHVALVLIKGPEILGDACKQRMFLADLLPALQEDSRARVIVIDERFSPERCSPEADSTRELKSAVEHARANIVYGRDADRAIDLPQPELGNLMEKGLDKNDVILKEGVLHPASPHLTEGLVRLNDDNRKIPLGWYGFSSKKSIGLEPRQYNDSLVVAAVRANDPSDSFIARLQDPGAREEDPFTSFLREEEFHPYSALDLVCHGSHNKHHWDCSKASSKPVESVDLGGRVVVVGEVDPDQPLDVHDTPVEKAAPGVVLQANYIESLLDHRSLKRVNICIEAAIALLWFGAIDLFFRRYSSRPSLALLYSALINLAVWFFLYNFLIIEAGYYVSVLVPGFLMIIARYIWALEMKNHGQRPVAASGAGGRL